METNFYDVVVCGGELTGLVAAALLGRRGFRVLLLGHDADRGSFEAGGFTLARGPALLPPVDGAPLARVLKELNCVQIVRRRAPAMAPGFQVAQPRQRFDVAAGAEALGAELLRELPRDRAVIEAVLARVAATSALLDPLLATEITLPPDGFWERREVGRLESLLPKVGADLLDGLPSGHPMRAVVAAPAALSGALAPNELGTVAQARAFDLARRGLHRLEGGTAALHALFLDKLQTFAGERREKLTPVEIVVRRGRAVGIRVRPRDETIGCQHLVWAGPAAAMQRILGDKAAGRGREAEAGLPVAAHRYALAMLLAPEALPEGMASRVFAVADPARPLLEDNALAVTVGQPVAREPPLVPVWVECVVPGSQQTDPGNLPAYLRALRARVLARLGRLLPFFERHLTVLASPYDGLPPQIPGWKGATPPPAVPASPLPPVYSGEGSRPFDAAGMQHATGVKNLYLAGRENLPGLGLEGELVSAWGVARLITGTQPKRDILRREVLISE
jgi:phytoene dehydrogenase-like protein